ncbi:MAG: NAD(P)/FAD-dependent oxidoreductase [Chloroflexota bacterium]
MRSLWMDPDEHHFPALEGDRETDIAIIGAGFSGIGAALGAAGEGARAIVLERQTVASGASGRNAGFVLAGAAMSFAEARRRLGAEAAREIWRFSDRNNAWIAETIKESTIDCGYLRRGSMTIAADFDEWQSLIGESAALREAGIENCLVEAERLPRPFDQLYVGGIYHPGNAELNPGALLRGLALQISRDARVDVYETAPVHAIHEDAGAWLVRTAAGSVRAPLVILATNAWTSRFLPDIPIQPQRGEVIASAPLGNVVVPFPMYGDRGFQYWRQTAEGRLVAGGWRNLDLEGEAADREEGFSKPVLSAIESFVSRVASTRAKIEHRWIGIMGFTPDQLPLTGPVPERSGLYLSAGFSGHGVSLAPCCGREVAREALGRPSSLPAAFSPGRTALPR